MVCRHFASLALVASLAAPCALAQTVYTVDDDGGPGIDFVTIQEAIDASSAGDRVEVMPGSYHAFVLDKGITLMGQPGAQIASAPIDHSDPFLRRYTAVAGIPANQTAVVADMECTGSIGWKVTDCAGAVILDHVVCESTMQVDDCDDFRLQSTPIRSILRSRRSTCNIVSCDGLGVDAREGSRVAISDCSLIGIDGSDGCSDGLVGSPAYGGTTALRASLSSEVWVSRSTLRGGHGGYDTCGVSDGPAGYAAIASNESVITICECDLQTSPHWIYPSVGEPIASVGSTIVETDDFPSMTLGGGNVIGDTALLECFAGAGTSARLYAGRFTRTETLADGILPRFHSSERGVSLGAMPTSGERTIGFTIPALQRATLVHAQMWRTRLDGTTELSNGVTLVVR